MVAAAQTVLALDSAALWLYLIAQAVRDDRRFAGFEWTGRASCTSSHMAVR
jgi:hypothetical protein